MTWSYRAAGLRSFQPLGSGVSVSRTRGLGCSCLAECTEPCQYETQTDCQGQRKSTWRSLAATINASCQHGDIGRIQRGVQSRGGVIHL